MAAQANGAVSFWWAQLGGPPRRRPALDRDVELDIAIVGAGFTGLWTAYALARHDPSLRIGIVERAFAGFGASGRNGGWLTGEFTWARDRYAAAASRERVIEFQRALWSSVDEVIAVAEREGIDADILAAGELRVATSPAQLARLEHTRATERDWGVGPQDSVLLDAAAIGERVAVAGALGGDWSPHAARIQPAKLARGLADVVESLGVRIWESTPAHSIEPHLVRTPRADVRAAVIVRATEGYTHTLAGHGRDLLPMNSSMVVTEPLSDRQWEAIGWGGCELLSDAAHGYFYAQRTADDRIAIGGRGIPYRFASAYPADGRTPESTVRRLRSTLTSVFPSLSGVRIDHAWSGILGVPRDWCAGVGLDERTGMAWAGGYVGIGVATANLAGRCLRDLVSGTGDLRDLPWTNWPVRQWEPEPARWLGVRSAYALYRWADRRENASGTASASWPARIGDRLTGRN